jgi:CRISPR/Cas system CSM-associated protein Csm3 (group 7 of RAMP superfamily)
MITSAIQRRLARDQRRIIRRIIIKGNLELQTPTCVSNGEMDGIADLNLLRDSIDPNRALLTGSTIAGALRHYLKSCLQDDTKLFGGAQSEEDGSQSPLIVDDAISQEPIETELRDGVGINLKTGTALTGAKYDFELLKAGTVFPLQFELLIDSSTEPLIKALAIALQGLEDGDIPIGMKKQRGFGQCKVASWQVWDFDMTQERDRKDWLLFNDQTPTAKQGKIAEILKVEVENQRDRFTLTANFSLEGAMLIRSGHGDLDAPDVVHLKSNDKPIISGTSLAGVLRHRATRILNTLGINLELCDRIFGFVNEKQKQAHMSRLIVKESEIKDSIELVQNRIAVDRFTGGALDGALFDEQPVFGNGRATVEIRLELHNPQDNEIGLLLLLLKDLWTSDLAIGGTSSIGRGRLMGKTATMKHKQRNWNIEQAENGLRITGREEMESCLKQLINPEAEG